MPPGTWHAVYTPEPSHVLGGHFYSFETMHLTELSLRFDYKYAEAATNAEHHNHRTFALMVLSLKEWKNEIEKGRRHGNINIWDLNFEN
jgi:hypothetical protein